MPNMQLYRESARVGVNEATDHFFVLGVHRSGTTMLRLMLNAHRDIAVPHESDFIVDMSRDLARFGSLDDVAGRTALIDAIADNRFVRDGGLMTPAGRAAANEERAYPAIVQRIFEAYAAQNGKRVWADKTPGNTIHIDTIAGMFPAARFVHLVRDGRDVALSHRRTKFGTYNMVNFAVRWALWTTVADKVGNVLGERYLRVRYEDLVEDPATWLAAICGFLGLPFDAGMLSFHEKAASQMPEASLEWHRNSVSAPKRDKIGEWCSALTPAQVSVFEDYAGHALQRFGYPLLNPPPSLALQIGKFRTTAEGGRLSRLLGGR